MNKTTEKQVVTQQAENDQTGVPSFETVKMENGTVAVEVTEEQHAKLQRIFASQSKPFIDSMLMEMRNDIMCKTADNKDALLSGLSMLKAIGPRDELETLLAMQMMSVHNAVMTFSRRLANAQALPQQDSAERTLNKLTRTFCAQMETLKKYRGGEQKITVQHQHVTVNDGGQAIVGTVEQGKGRGEG